MEISKEKIETKKIKEDNLRTLKKYGKKTQKGRKKRKTIKWKSEETRRNNKNERKGKKKW